MAITPEEARTELQRREALAELQRRGVVPVDGTWGQEASHALARGSFKAAASVPGTLATLMEAGARMPGSWGRAMSEADNAALAAKNQETVRSLRRSAKDIYQAAGAPSLAPKKGGVGGYILNTVLETAPLLVASTAATAAAGPAGGFGVGAMAMGEEGYQAAKAGGADDATAEAERAINFMIGGALERLQADEILKLGKGSVKAIIKAARDRAWKKLGKEAGKLTAEQLAGAASEGLTESLQEATLIGSAALHGEKIATMENLKRVGAAGLGGFTAGGVMKAGHTLLAGGGDTAAEPRPANAPAYEEGSTPAAVPMTMEELGREVRGEQAELPVVGDTSVATSVTKPRVRVQAELGKDVSSAPSGDEYKMSARQADVDTGRGRRDMELVESQDSIPWAESARMAQEQGIKDKALAIATTINAEPRALTHVETAGMVDKAIEMDNQYEQLTSQMAEASNKGDTEAVKVLSTAINQNQAEYDALTRAIHSSGSEKGRDLASQKLTKGRDFRLVSVVTRATAVKGAPLTAEEQAGLAEDVKKLEEATKAAQPVERKAAEDAAAGTLGLPTTGRRTAARRPPRQQGLRRYLTMTEAEKDAELQALLGRDKDAKTLAKIADNLASRAGVENFEDVTRRMTELIPGIERSTIVDAINTAAQRQARVTDDAMNRLQEIARRQPKENKKLRTAIADVLYYLNSGEVPGAQRRIGGETWDVNQKLAEIRDMLRNELRNSEPAQKQRLQEQIAYLKARIANEDYATRPKAAIASTPELDRMRYTKARLQHQVRQRIAAMRPKTPWQTVMAPFRFIQSWKSAFDVSAVRRQGGWMVLSHPVRSLRRVPDMFRAGWSEAEAYRINEGIMNRPNAPRYAAAKVEFTDPGTPGAFTEREEMFRSDLANHIPGIQASNRAYATFLNLIRADAFDAMTDAFLADGGAGTAIEERAIANYINVATGRGATGSMKAAADAMNGLFWSPRYVISRFQMVFAQPLYRGTWRTRKAIAKEYARYLAGVVIVQILGKLIGGDREDDSRSSDFWKLRFGNTRLDPLSGLSQTVVFARRVISGKTKRASGDVVAIRGKGVPYGGDNTADVIARFLRTKLAPAPGMVLDVATGENVVGEPTTARSMITGAMVPLSMGDIYDTMVEQGVPAGTVLSILSIFGEGIQTYQPKEKHNTLRGAAIRRRTLRRGVD
jgi:hypothetical protein